MTISYLKNKPGFYLRFITGDFKSGHLINRRRERERKREKSKFAGSVRLSARKRKTLPGHRFPIPFRDEGAVGFINARGIISARYRSSFPPLRGLPPSSDKTVHFYLESGRLEKAKQPSGIASYSPLSDVPSRIFFLRLALSSSAINRRIVAFEFTKFPNEMIQRNIDEYFTCSI